MDLHYILYIAFFGALIEAKEFLRTGSGDTISIPEDSKNNEPDILALVIVEHTNSEASNKTILSENEMMVPWVDHLNSDYDIDSSGESNSDEYQDSDSDSESEIDTSTESSYYHEDDYKTSDSSQEASKSTNKVEMSDYVHEADVLRKRWRSCQKKASKVCREACVVAYKNSCDEHKCKRKLKRTLKKQCKTQNIYTLKGRITTPYKFYEEIFPYRPAPSIFRPRKLESRS